MSVSQPTVASGAPVAPAVTTDEQREAERYIVSGHHLSQQGRFREAESLYRKAIELRPGLPLAHNNLGWVRQMQGDGDGAVASYRRALQLDPGLRIARRNLAPLLVQLGRFDESIDLWHAEMLSGAAGHGWVDELISNAMGGRDLTLAGEYAELFARIRWGTQWYPPRRDKTLPPLSPQTPPVSLSMPKLLHDIEQFLYLQRHGIFGGALTPVINDYERTVERLATLDTEARVPLDDEARQAIGHVYNRIIHVRDTPRVKRTLSERWDAGAVESDYLDRPPGIVVVDDFLSAEALEELRLFCLESTVWLANRYAHGRLGAFFRDGFNCPLLLQIAEELRGALPRVIGDRYPLRQLWGFKNDHSLPADSTTHADFAAVNVNFWITPDESNLDEGSGGMVIYDLDAPLDWDFTTYNGRSGFIRSYLQLQQARAVCIPYRQNRAIIFNSDLFHTTSAVHFRPGYEHRRMNITMLYGHREHDVHHRQEGHRNLTPGPASWRSAAFSRTRRSR
ncbi:MAG: tetratricopeptide repeat protein [Pyrinomonadaceae bacterium]